MNSNTTIVKCEGQKYEVPTTTKGAELRGTFGLHERSALYTQCDGGLQLIEDADVIEVAPGQQFGSVGPFFLSP